MGGKGENTEEAGRLEVRREVDDEWVFSRDVVGALGELYPRKDYSVLLLSLNPSRVPMH